MRAAVTATSLSPGRLPQSCCCSRQPTIFVVGSAATFPGSGVGDRILARRASHTTRDIVTSQNGTRSPPLWRLRETMDVHYAHTGEEATGTQYIHPIARFPSIIMIGGQSIILTTLNRTALDDASINVEIARARHVLAAKQLNCNVRVNPARGFEDDRRRPGLSTS